MNKMSNREVEELAARVKAMSPEELAVVATVIPVEYCLGRIQSEIGRAQAMEKQIKSLAYNLGE